MKIITDKELETAVFNAASEMCFGVDGGVERELNKAYEIENGGAKDALGDIIENIKIARSKHIPLCQDTGIVIVFAEVGNLVVFDCDFEKVVNSAISAAYKQEYLRKSVVASPIERKNTGDNTPAIFHVKLVSGDSVKITLCPKGAGSENMGGLKMLSPAEGVNGITDFVLQTVKKAGGKACPPLIVGVGIGGDMEQCALISKRALLRDVGDENPSKALAELERSLLEKINGLGIGAMGLGGKVTALAVKIEAYPCHIASLPVAVSLMCHAARHKEVIL